MTIKPVVVQATPKRSVAPSDTDKKENHPLGEQSSNIGHNQQNASTRNSVVHSHRSGVGLDSRGQSPTRRAEVGVGYDELNRRRSPHKISRSKRRDRVERNVIANEKHTTASTSVTAGLSSGTKSTNAHLHGILSNSGTAGGNISGNIGVGIGSNNINNTGGICGRNSPATNNNLNKLNVDIMSNTNCKSQAINLASSKLSPQGAHSIVDDAYSGYNSGDEHQPKKAAVTVEEWTRRDKQFEKSMADIGYTLKNVEEDGACLFRAISLQIYGDEDMHDVIRQHTMDYIYKNREYFCHFVTEDINAYIKRKRRKDSHGNHIEIQALSEIYNRPVELYCYKPTPINIFNSEQLNCGYAPLRLSYQRGSHYNAIIDPYNATVGVGLGLAGYKPELEARQAQLLSEQLEIEQTMFEDKLKTTDWEATNEAIEEQIARESYLQWCRENLRNTRAATVASASSTASSSASTSATVTSADVRRAADALASTITPPQQSPPPPPPLLNPSKLTRNEATGLAAGGIADMKISGDTKDITSIYRMQEEDDAVEGAAALLPLSGASDIDKVVTEADSSTIKVAYLSFESIDDDCDVYSNNEKDIKERRAVAHAIMQKTNMEQKSNTSAEESVSESLKDFSEKNVKQSREKTPDAEQQPCTSKQSNSPSNNENKTDATDNSTSAKTLSCNNSEPCISSFYQELLAASFDASGYGQLSESEMLQQAIQMSTQDYIEDQKRKFLYGK